MTRLLDQYCAEPHNAAITAAARDPASGATVTADKEGVVAITPPRSRYPMLVFQVGGPVQGAVAMNHGGSLAAVGDDTGAVQIFRTDTGDVVFHDAREGAAGAARAMRAMAFSSREAWLATLSVDGIIRIYDYQRGRRINNFDGYRGGRTLEFDPARPDRLLAIDSRGQPVLIEVATGVILEFEQIPGGVQAARFTGDGRYVVTMGQTGVSLLALPEQSLVRAQQSRGGALVNVLVHPDGNRVAALSARSCHVLSLPDLELIASERHGAANPTGAAYWDRRSVQVGGEDGRFRRPGAGDPLGHAVCVSGTEDHRVVVHGSKIAIWHRGTRFRSLDARAAYVEVRIDREGALLVALAENGPLHVYDLRQRKFLFDAGVESIDSPRFAVGGPIVAFQTTRGGLKWFDLANDRGFQLDDVTAFALSGSGSLLAVADRAGGLRLLDPSTGDRRVESPVEPLHARVLAFVNRSPELLALDEDGVLSYYDLRPNPRSPVPVRQEILAFSVPVDEIWGLTGGTTAALRLQDPQYGTSIAFVNLRDGNVQEVSGIPAWTSVDADTGVVMYPELGCAVVELDRTGREHRVLRSLPDDEWISFGPEGVLASSPGAFG